MPGRATHRFVSNTKILISKKQMNTPI